MSKARGLRALLAALCISGFAFDSAVAQDAAEGAQPVQGSTVVSPGADAASKPGWLLGGQNRAIDPFRTAPAPGAAPAPAGRPLPRGIAPLSRSLNVDRGQQVPENATANALGKGWTCNSGFRRVGASCVPVQVPANASLDFSGHGWMCNRGFRREGQGCVALVIPENASLDDSGMRWACNPGFRRQGQACVAVVVPEHASLDKSGHNWVCNPGYQQRGQGCIDDATARLQQQADRAVNARPAGQAAGKAPSISVQSGENRQGRTSKAKVIIGRF